MPLGPTDAMRIPRWACFLSKSKVLIGALLFVFAASSGGGEGEANSKR